MRFKFCAGVADRAPRAGDLLPRYVELPRQKFEIALGARFAWEAFLGRLASCGIHRRDFRARRRRPAASADPWKAGRPTSVVVKDRTRPAQLSHSRDAASPRVCSRSGASRAVPDDSDGPASTRPASPSAGACADGDVDPGACRDAIRDRVCAGFRSAVRPTAVPTSILEELPLPSAPAWWKPPARGLEIVSCETPLDHVDGNSAEDCVVPDRGGTYRRIRCAQEVGQLPYISRARSR